MRNEILDLVYNGMTIYGGSAMSPNNEEKTEIFGPLHMITYAKQRTLDIATKTLVMRNTDKVIDIRNGKKYIMNNLTKAQAEKLCRCDFSNIGYKKGVLYTYDNSIIAEITTNNGVIKPIVFPFPNSNVGVFCNANNVTSYVIDGRVHIVNGELFLINSTQRALDKYFEDSLEKKDDEIMPSLANYLSKEYWQIKSDDDKEDTKIIKALNILGYTEDMVFPLMDDGTPYNVVWSDNEIELSVLAEEYDLSSKIRYSSLSQNGESALCGPIGNATTEGYRINTVKPFMSTKGKLDNSATQGVKTYKQSMNTKRCLVVLAEICQQGTDMPLNSMGNMLVTKQAYDVYVSDLTRKKAMEHKVGYPAHKVFIKCNGELSRVKGAASFLDMKATLQDGTIEDKIVVMPPREYSTKGILEEDTAKFEFLCKYRDSDSHLQMVTLEVEGQKIVCPALYCWIYEDAAHSSVYSLKIKPQNIFYYGSMLNIYQFNGSKKMKDQLSSMLDSKRITHAMNFAGVTKESEEEINYIDFINSL